MNKQEIYALLGARNIWHEVTEHKAVYNMAEVAEIQLPYSHTLAIKTDGTLWAWGQNEHGQVGNGSTEPVYTPVKVMDQVSAACVDSSYSMAIKTDGSLWAWGYNKMGQLGDRTLEDKLQPVKIMEDVVRVCTSAFSAKALKSDGSLWMWGDLAYDGGTPDIRSTVSSMLTMYYDVAYPRKMMDGVKDVVMRSSGGINTYVIKQDDTLWGWGINNRGELGMAPTGTIYFNQAIKLMEQVKQVYVDDLDTTAVLKQDGSLWIIGEQLRVPQGSGDWAPVKVMDGVRTVQVNGLLAAALKADGSAWVWGVHAKDLFVAAAGEISAPQKLTDQVAGMVVMPTYLLLVKEDGTLWSGGMSDMGQLGRGWEGYDDYSLDPPDPVPLGCKTKAFISVCGVQGRKQKPLLSNLQRVRHKGCFHLLLQN